MAKPKVPIISTDARDQALNFDSAIWRQIENACGVSLPPNVRADIDRVTQAFLFFESFEHAPEPLAKVKVILEAHDKAATRFFNELFASPFAGSDAGVYAHHLIEKNFKEFAYRTQCRGVRYASKFTPGVPYCLQHLDQAIERTSCVFNFPKRQCLDRLDQSAD